MSQDYLSDSVFALASGLGKSPVAIIRVSGENSHSLLIKCLQRTSSHIHANMLQLCSFINPSSKQVIDKPMVVFFCGSRSYTGEDSAELHIHGSEYIQRQVSLTLLEVGFREADPGEFTRRAYYNGKMNLVDAEGLHVLINSSTEQEWLAARSLLGGNLQAQITSLRKQAVSALSYVEAMIDFPEEPETQKLYIGKILKDIKELITSISALSDTYQSGRVSTEGLSLVLLGPPNAGKSTLLNLLLAKQRAIVTDTPGTTRDYLQEKFVLNGHLINLIDTAGVRESDDKIESLGIAKSVELAKKADLVVALYPCDMDLQLKEKWQNKVESLKATKVLKVASKCDLGDLSWADKSFTKISCNNNQGITELKEKIVSEVKFHVNKISAGAFITSQRHLIALQKSLASLKKAQDLCIKIANEEMISFELQESIRSLQSILGAIDNEEILGEIFSSFCIGK